MPGRSLDGVFAESRTSGGWPGGGAGQRGGALGGDGSCPGGDGDGVGPAASYAPGLHVVGAAAGSVPGDLKVTAASLNGGAFAGFGLDAVIGLHTASP